MKSITICKKLVKWNKILSENYFQHVIIYKNFGEQEKKIKFSENNSDVNKKIKKMKNKQIL